MKRLIVPVLCVGLLTSAAVYRKPVIAEAPAVEVLVEVPRETIYAEIAVVEETAVVEEIIVTPPLYDIPLSEELQLYTYNLCEEYGIVDHHKLVLAVMGHESVFKPNLISSTNDYGLMQINKVNHKWLSKQLCITNFLDPKQNIRCGVHMLSTYLIKYDTVNEALMAYNRGEGGARKLWKKGIYTINYTNKVHAELDSIQIYK